MRTIHSIIGLAAITQAQNLRDGYEMLQDFTKSTIKIDSRSEAAALDPIPWTSSPDFTDSNNTVKYFGITEGPYGGIHRMACMMHGAQPWCPESAEEANQVFSNLAINFMKDVKGLKSKDGKRETKIEDSSMAMFVNMLGSVWTGLDATDATSTDIADYTCMAINNTWTPDSTLDGYFTPNTEADFTCTGMGSNFEMLLGNAKCDPRDAMQEIDAFKAKQQNKKASARDTMAMVMKMGKFNKELKRGICVTTKDMSGEELYRPIDPANVATMKALLPKMKATPTVIKKMMQKVMMYALLFVLIVPTCCCFCCCCCCCKPCKGSGESSAEAPAQVVQQTVQHVQQAPAAPPMMPPAAAPMAPPMPAYGAPAYGGYQQQPQQPMGGLNLNISNNNTNTN